VNAVERYGFAGLAVVLGLFRIVVVLRTHRDRVLDRRREREQHAREHAGNGSPCSKRPDTAQTAAEYKPGTDDSNHQALGTPNDQD